MNVYIYTNTCENDHKQWGALQSVAIVRIRWSVVGGGIDLFGTLFGGGPSMSSWRVRLAVCVLLASPGLKTSGHIRAHDRSHVIFRAHDCWHLFCLGRSSAYAVAVNPETLRFGCACYLVSRKSQCYTTFFLYHANQSATTKHAGTTSQLPIPVH